MYDHIVHSNWVTFSTGGSVVQVWLLENPIRCPIRREVEEPVSSPPKWWWLSVTHQATSAVSCPFVCASQPQACKPFGTESLTCESPIHRCLFFLDSFASLKFPQFPSSLPWAKGKHLLSSLLSPSITLWRHYTKAFCCPRGHHISWKCWEGRKFWKRWKAACAEKHWECWQSGFSNTSFTGQVWFQCMPPQLSSENPQAVLATFTFTFNPGARDDPLGPRFLWPYSDQDLIQVTWHLSTILPRISILLDWIDNLLLIPESTVDLTQTFYWSCDLDSDLPLNSPQTNRYSQLRLIWISIKVWKHRLFYSKC